MNKAALFDIDDTLIPTSDFIENVLHQSVVSMINAGLQEKNPNHALKRLHEIRNHNEEKNDNDLDLLCYSYGNYDKKIVTAGVKRYQAMKKAAFQTNIYAIETLEYLKNKGYKLGVVSTGRTEKQKEKLIIGNLEHFFENHFYASINPNETKPSSILFERALKNMNANKEESFYVGNRIDVDIMGAHNAGIKGILLLCGNYSGQTPTSLLIKKGIEGKEILSGKYDSEIKSMTPEYTINSLDEIKGIY